MLNFVFLRFVKMLKNSGKTILGSMSKRIVQLKQGSNLIISKVNMRLKSKQKINILLIIYYLNLKRKRSIQIEENHN